MKIEPLADVTDFQRDELCELNSKSGRNVYLRESVAKAKRRLQLRQGKMEIVCICKTFRFTKFRLFRI